MIEEFFKHIITNLVENPGAVNITVKNEAGRLFVEIRVDSTDFGRIIGKEGRTFKAIQALGAAIDPALHERNITLDILN